MGKLNVHVSIGLEKSIFCSWIPNRLTLVILFAISYGHRYTIYNTTFCSSKKCTSRLEFYLKKKPPYKNAIVMDRYFQFRRSSAADADRKNEWLHIENRTRKKSESIFAGPYVLVLASRGTILLMYKGHLVIVLSVFG